ncbi:major facilitator superfamily domain-containing protein 3 isoform X1 [Megalops cyprinoides]|uniref:major facilitator superfamily domain-containing protein 3 isoform X1 n=1 Tax=Megalops cyprinoides TaxID=118141 RepID=UPI0018652EFB|nr:major facilitator superfamily domain-containing protein 3 isoform X1 [Megalops cyprinoides]XP_036383512.1 major facilitator superfamily domain-containing protein 3 isoform X1 [Megalops cyprinoides]XP_036383513.1 major facilitator superfamily domain-containing protein 3 isoform X1 [Megalops cyprinoides]
MNQKLLFLGLLYFVQGMPYGLQSSLLPIYLRSSGLSLTKISLTKVLYFPWVLKVLWAPLVDQVGTKRKWLVATMSGLSLTCLACTVLSPAAEFAPVATALLAMNVLASVQDIAVDSVAVQLLQQREEVGYGNTAQVVGYKLGSVAAGGGLLAVVDAVGWGSLFLALSAVYCAVSLHTWRTAALSAPAKGHSTARTSHTAPQNPWRVWRDLLTVPGTKWTVVFVLTYKLGEQGAVSMFPLFLLDHHMTAAELGFWNSMVAMGFSICGSSIGGLLLSKYSVRPLMRRAFVLRLVGMAFQTSLLGVRSYSTLVKGGAILSLIVQHFLGGLITTLTFTTMMHCTQRADESIQVRAPPSCPYACSTARYSPSKNAHRKGSIQVTALSPCPAPALPSITHLPSHLSSSSFSCMQGHYCSYEERRLFKPQYTA